MRQAARWLAAISVVLGAAACSSDDNGDSGGTPPPDSPGGSTAPTSRYAMANGCYALQSVSRGSYAVQTETGYAATAAAVTGAEPFFMKPTALGKYLIYARDASFVVAGTDTVAQDTAVGEAADWTIDGTPQSGFTLVSESAARTMSVNADGALVLVEAADAGSRFNFAPAKGCTEYPEAQLNLAGDTFKGQGVSQPVLGFADVHQHISATHFLGGAHYGLPFHRFGIIEALKDCLATHGPQGMLDIVGNFLGGNPLGMHDTVGWPTFAGWPQRGSLMHESLYYKWIERTYKAGLRLLVNDLVENQLLCTLQSKAPEFGGSGLRDQECNEMTNAMSQVQFMHDMQDYIDAQEGGPGKGWFRLVTTPGQARQVINDGKLAVVLGIEISHLFNCNVTKLLGNIEIQGCTQADIDSQIDTLYNLGVRQMFPIHEFDNAFGGNGIFDGFVLNIGNFGDTGGFWQTYDCPAGDYFYEPGAVMMTSDPSGSADPLISAVLGPIGGVATVPLYSSARQCNARWLTPIGEYAIKKIMQKRMILEIDHLELKVKDQVMDIAAAQTPVYPVNSSHGGHGGISMAQASRILDLGGVIFPGGGTNGKQFVALLNKQKSLHNENFLGMGIGADTNGLAHQADPRGSDATPVTYPFTLFKGPDWGDKFAKVTPIIFGKEVTGERTFDINEEGWAHYGLAADFVEEVRIEGGGPALNALYNSAEAYLQMWEKTVSRP